MESNVDQIEQDYKNRVNELIDKAVATSMALDNDPKNPDLEAAHRQALHAMRDYVWDVAKARKAREAIEEALLRAIGKAVGEIENTESAQEAVVLIYQVYTQNAQQADQEFRDAVNRQ